MGGSCAVANIILRILFDLALDQPNRAHVQDQIKNQIHTLHKSNDGLVSIEDRVPLLKAAMHETIRLTCSPIVPHQATQDSEIGGELKIKLIALYIVKSCQDYYAAYHKRKIIKSPLF